MKQATLRRLFQTPCGVLGRFVTDGFRCYTIELPWRDNRSNVSCIPAGIYECEWTRTPHHGWVYHIKNVPHRFAVLFHPGNYAGEKPCITHSMACILPGLKYGILAGQFAVLNSATACRLMADALNRETFRLHIEEAF